MAGDSAVTSNPRKRLALSVVVLLILGGIAAWSFVRERPERPIHVVKVGSRLPQLEGRRLDGTDLDLSSFLGKPLVINFWASWCTPCRKEFPLLGEALKSRNFNLLGVDYKDSSRAARAFMNEFHARWPSVVDDQQRWTRTFAISTPPGIPQTIFVDRAGILRSHVYGQMNYELLHVNLQKIISDGVSPTGT